MKWHIKSNDVCIEPQIGDFIYWKESMRRHRYGIITKIEECSWKIGAKTIYANFNYNKEEAMRGISDKHMETNLTIGVGTTIIYYV